MFFVLSTSVLLTRERLSHQKRRHTKMYFGTKEKIDFAFGGEFTCKGSFP